MATIIERLKSLTRMNRRRVDTVLTTIHKKPLLMFIVNVFFLSISLLIRLSKVLLRMLERLGLFANRQQRNLSTYIAPQQTAMSARPISRHPSVLLVVEESIPQCFRYRVQQKMELLQELDWRHEWLSWRELAAVKEKVHFYDVILFYRVPGFPDVINIMQYAAGLNKIMLYDLDDLIFDEQRLAEKFKGATGQLLEREQKEMLRGASIYRKAIETCSYALASTPVLAQEMARIVGAGICTVFPNTLDKGLLAHVDTPPVPRSDDFVDIFYGSGTRTHDEDFATIAPVLVKILKENEDVRLIIVGHLTIPAELKVFSARIRILPIMPFDSYLTVLSQAKLCIAPLELGFFADCKSEIKWIESAIFKIPCVVSATRTYREIIEDGIDGCLADNQQQWYEALTKLVNDTEYRLSVGETAHKKVMRLYGVEAMSRKFSDIVDRYIDHAVDRGIASLATETKKKLLYVNTVYPPSSIGGATVVMKNIIDNIQQRFSDRYDVMVFTCDIENPLPNQLREYEYDGVNVTALSVSASPDLEWKYRDDDVERIFSEYLRFRKPDLIHFHSMQRLTASPLRAAIAENIPYIVTAHDAWWISDHQFLIDDNGEPVDELQRNPLVAANTSQDIVSTLERAEYLAGALRSASSLLAVSEYQASLYRKNGFKEILINKNGVSMTAGMQPAGSDLSTLRLAYLGGVCMHKGYYFLKQVFSRSHFENLQLKVVDFNVGENITERWGENEVELIPPIEMDRMDEFYNTIDVVIAPSMWPESFGLVSREAILMGKWVIVSDAGGLAEDVTEGKDGHIFSIGDDNRLHELFSELNNNMSKYQYPPVTNGERKINTVSMQVDELDSLYCKLLKDSG